MIKAANKFYMEFKKRDQRKNERGNYYEWLNNPCFHGEVDRENIELSDIITFHFYGDYTHARRMVKFLKQFNRPLINTEWMHNLYHADFTPYDQEELDILKKCNEDKNIWK